MEGDIQFAIRAAARSFAGILKEENELLSGNEREQLGMARGVFYLFAKALKAIRLYMGQGHHVEQFTQDLYTGLTTFLDTFGPLRVTITPMAFEHLDRPAMVMSEEAQDDLIYELFIDGIRGLNFEPGLQFDEMRALMKLLVSDLGERGHAEEDRVTLLWKSNYPHIQYEAVELLTDGGLFQGSPEYRSVYRRRLSELVSVAAKALTPERKHAHHANERVETGRHQGGRDPYLHAYQGFAIADSLGMMIPPEGVDVRTMLRADSELLPRRFVEYVFDQLDHYPDDSDLTRLVERTVMLIEEILIRGDFDELHATTEVFATIPMGPDASSRRLLEYRDHVFGRLAALPRLILMKEPLESGDEAMISHALAFIGMIPKHELPQAVELLLKLEEGVGARSLSNLLEAMGVDLTPFLKDRLHSSNMIAVLEALKKIASIKTDAAQSAIRGLLRHRNVSVRREALLALRHSWDTDLFKATLVFLQEEEAPLRTAALEVAIHARDDALAEPLETLAERSDFAKKSQEERVLHVSALYASDPERALSFATRYAQVRNPFMRKRGRVMQETALLGLIHTRHDEALHFVKEWMAAESPSTPAYVTIEASFNQATAATRGGK